MKKSPQELSIEIYHRIYRLAAKKVNAQQIALTLDLPVTTVRNVLERFYTGSKKEQEKTAQASLEKHDKETTEQTYLDIYILQKTRSTIIDLNGMATVENISRLQKELDTVLNSNMRIVAIMLAHVKKIDTEAFHVIYKFYKDFHAKGRYTALLDPSPSIENFIVDNEVEKKIPIFGTEKAFEENALKTKKEKERG